MKIYVGMSSMYSQAASTGSSVNPNQDYLVCFFTEKMYYNFSSIFRTQQDLGMFKELSYEERALDLDRLEAPKG